MRITRLALFLTLAITALRLLRRCAALPYPVGRTSSVRLADGADTRLGRAIAPLAQAHGAQCGVVPLPSGRDAFAARMRLADAAERSLDVRYYLWHKDLSGTLLFDALRRAADRGVRVRLLLDDNGTAGLDETLAVLDAHAHIEVRLFNPFRARHWRLLGYVFDFSRLNRRMHNKSFTADNQATVIGGRNVGDEYFGAPHDFLFVDLDVLAIGPVVEDVSLDFDRYWASASAYPADRVLPAISAASISRLAVAATAVERQPAALAYTDAVKNSLFVEQLLAGTLSFEWAQVAMLSDDPAKGLGLAPKDELVWPQLKQVIEKAERELKLVSAYFVPGAVGAHFFAGMQDRGVGVTVLTNSLAATDVAAVHAGYAKRRKPLLKAGVKIFELKRATAGVRSALKRTANRIPGSSSASLHAKTFSIDESRIFIGSFNFDLRSARLNTEMGFVVDSPSLAKALADSLARDLPDSAYQVRLAPDGTLRWVERVGGAEIVHHREPGAGLGKRARVALISLLPIEWLL